MLTAERKYYTMNDKVAIVTGGSSGMGLAISQELKSKGIKMIIFDIQRPPETFDYYCVDIRDDGQIKSSLENISKVDILINNAGIYFERYLEDTTNDEIDRMVDINIKGTYLMSRNVLSKIKETKGCIVTIASCFVLIF